jgi:hypothetical protein
MNTEMLNSLLEYIDAAVELGVAQHSNGGMHDDGGYSSSNSAEEQAVKVARQRLFDLLKPKPKPFPVESGTVYDFKTNQATVIEGGKAIETRKDFLQ